MHGASLQWLHGHSRCVPCRGELLQSPCVPCSACEEHVSLCSPISGQLTLERQGHARNAGRMEVGLVDALRNHGVGYEWRDGRRVEIGTLLF